MRPATRWMTPCVLLAAATAFFTPGLSEFLIYRRSAILSGEIWRLFTGSWAHFSPDHLVFDLLAVGIAGGVIQHRGCRALGALYLLMPMVIGLGLFFGEPGLESYGGLSGIATGLVTYLALAGLKEETPWRRICAIALLLTGCKILFEAVTGHAIFLPVDDSSTRVCWQSHLLAALTAALVYAAPKRWTRDRFHN